MYFSAVGAIGLYFGLSLLLHPYTLIVRAAKGLMSQHICEDSAELVFLDTMISTKIIYLLNFLWFVPDK